jgi:prepilin-type N-terminal cleavage/methylation domain-containing protein
MKTIVERKSLRSKKGFTVIELIIVITAVAVLTGVVGVNMQHTNETTTLFNAANKALADIRYAEEVAMSTHREVDFLVYESANRYEVQYADDGSYVKSPLTGENLIVQLDDGMFSGVEISSSATDAALSFTATGEPNLNGSTFNGERSVARFNNAIHLIIVETGFAYLDEEVGGTGCGFTICGG